MFFWLMILIQISLLFSIFLISIFLSLFFFLSFSLSLSISLSISLSLYFSLSLSLSFSLSLSTCIYLGLFLSRFSLYPNKSPLKIFNKMNCKSVNHLKPNCQIFAWLFKCLMIWNHAPYNNINELNCNGPYFRK